MKNTLNVALLSLALLLVGAGCIPKSRVMDLPAEPPAAAPVEVMVKPDADDTMVPKPVESTMPGAEPAAEKMEKKETVGEPAVAADKKMSDLKPYYIAYSAAQSEKAVKEGRPTVLYFWASWCPICRAEEPKLQTWIENSGLPIAGFRVNFDSESELKKKYKIPYQHTTVFLNAKSEEVERLNGPVDEATFMEALKKAAR